jgi:hypothetical protein
MLKVGWLTTLPRLREQRVQNPRQNAKGKKREKTGTRCELLELAVERERGHKNARDLQQKGRAGKNKKGS